MPIIGGRQASVRGLGFQGAGKPNQVTGLTATDVGTNRAYNNGAIDLSWIAPASNGAPITGYFIERSTDNSTWSTLVSNTGTSSTTYQNISLSSNQIYYYRISAINAVGTGDVSLSANATATTVPQAPTIGTATAAENTANVTFTSGATGGKSITTYTVISSPGSITSTGATSPVKVSGLTNNTSYTFTVTATNANGTSTASSSSNSITATLPVYYYTSSTTYTPASYPATLTIYAIGGGGGMGGYQFAGSKNYSALSAGGGGGGGFYSTASGVVVNSGSVTVTVGAGGTNPGQTSASGNTGGTSSTSVGGVSASGGSGGGGTNSANAGGGNGGNGGSGGGGGGGYYFQNDIQGYNWRIDPGAGGSSGANGGASVRVSGSTGTLGNGGTGSGGASASAGGSGGSNFSASPGTYNGINISGTNYGSGRGRGGTGGSGNYTGDGIAGFVIIQRTA